MTAQTLDFGVPALEAAMSDVLDWGARLIMTETPVACPHVLLVVGDQKTRYTLADMLLTAGCRLTMCSTYGAADLLLESTSPFDLMLAAQPVEEWSGVARLARSANTEVPILMVEVDTASGPGVLAAVQSALERWPASARD